ncbi:MAG: transglycosylase domain-containing protein [Roseibacillus sp.]
MTWLEEDEPKLWDQIPSWVGALGRIFLRVSLIVVVLLILVGVGYWVTASRYDIKEIKEMPERTLLLDREGNELAAIHGSRRRVIPRDEIPQGLIDALTAREDKEFFKHGGVHFRGVLRAALRNLKDGGITQGASTITMQLARNTYEIRELSLHRKLLEATLSFRIEANYSKDEIVTAYLNRIYFGAGAYGIEQAAQSYFGKKTSQLTTAESALLVGIIRAPHDFSPRNDREAALRERDQVLRQMAADGKLTFQQRDDSLKAPLHLLPPREVQTDAIRCARRHLNELLDQNDFLSGGLTATSSIDRELQKFARNGIDELITPFPALQCALVAIEPTTGAIRAVITARDPESSQFNRAFDTRRQLGPVFQPFLYAFSAERGRLPIPGQPIQTARQMPDGEIARLAKRLGINGPFTEGDELARGNLQTTPLEAATALTVLANQGKKPTTYLIENLLDAHGDSLFQQEPQNKLVLDAFAAQAPLDLTKQKTWSALNNPSNDLWALHTDEHLSVALWLGFDDPGDLPEAELLENGASALISALSRIATSQAKDRALEEAAEQSQSER